MCADYTGRIVRESGEGRAAVTAVARVVLTGFSGTGKSTVAGLVAQRLGWHAVDMDLEIERQAGMSIPAIFREHGEDDFRQREREALRAAVNLDSVVVATGGGACASEAAWADDVLRSPGTLVVTLDADPETIVARLRAQQAAQGETAERPMLAGEDPVARIRALKAQRQAYYDRADITLALQLQARLGQPPFQPRSPAGFGDVAADWGGPDALYKRVQAAQEMADRLPAVAGSTPLQLGQAVLGGALDGQTATALRRAESVQQGVALLLASPAFQWRA